MCSVEPLREFIRERLTAAAEEIFTQLEKTIVQYEEEIDRQRRLLDLTWRPRTEPNPAGLQQQEPVHQDLWQQNHCNTEDVPSDLESSQQNIGSGLNPKEPEPIKEKLHDVLGWGAEQLVKQEPDPCMVTVEYVDMFPTKAEPNTTQIFSQNSSKAEIQSQERSNHKDSGSCRDEAPKGPTSDDPDLRTAENEPLTEENLYSCQFCGKNFTTCKDLKVHWRTHMEKKRHTCGVCGKTLSDRSSLRKHLRIHTGEKPYPCEVCGKRFRNSCGLTKHFRIHTGEKPFTCQTCGMRFNQSSILYRHMKRKNH
ncbi:PREDICTED: zinc finger protein 3-like isoform X2 [Poecilia mexicana]|uniref:C2H2-type domain-containing protein n=1 Tax=Poecilia mexicana TaxID=48701 RepID=A0A3B3Z4S7_9TELE|nr:PREDICTED: zinc finger protein 3-like isoform X2 [Poecilia mexicana]